MIALILAILPLVFQVPPSTVSAHLGFTATGDDSTVGTASSYDLRWSLDSLTAARFDSATAIPVAQLPAEAGTLESLTVTGLPAGLRAFFALKAVDDAGNASATSNVAGVTGQPEGGPYSLTGEDAGAFTFNVPLAGQPTHAPGELDTLQLQFGASGFDTEGDNYRLWRAGRVVAAWRVVAGWRADTSAWLAGERPIWPQTFGGVRFLVWPLDPERVTFWLLESTEQVQLRSACAICKAYPYYDLRGVRQSCPVCP